MGVRRFVHPSDRCNLRRPTAIEQAVKQPRFDPARERASGARRVAQCRWVVMSRDGSHGPVILSQARQCSPSPTRSAGGPAAFVTNSIRGERYCLKSRGAPTTFLNFTPSLTVFVTQIEQATHGKVPATLTGAAWPGPRVSPHPTMTIIATPSLRSR